MALIHFSGLTNNNITSTSDKHTGMKKDVDRNFVGLKCNPGHHFTRLDDIDHTCDHLRMAFIFRIFWMRLRAATAPDVASVGINLVSKYT